MTNVQTTRRKSCGKPAFAVALIMTLSLSGSSSILAQEGAQTFSRTPISGGATTTTEQNRRAFGTLFRVGHAAGDTVGRTDSLSHMSLAPYFNHENSMLFGDIRLGRANEGPLTWSFGSGVRHYIPDLDIVIGGNGYLDRDDLTGALLKSWGIGGEVLANGWEGRFNYYRPHGTTSTLVSQTIDQNSASFAGNNILFNRIDTVAEALQGFDLEAGFLLPCGPMEDHVELRAFGGAYQYRGDTIPQFTGWKGRLQADIAEWLELGLQLTEDSQFKTGISFNAVVYFGEFKSQDYTRHSAIHRMAEPVRRNLNIAASRSSVVVGGLTAIDPGDGLALEVVHVNSNHAGPFLGTVDDPLSSLDAGIGTPGADLVFVHAGSDFNAGPDNSVIINPGQDVFGEGLIMAASGDRLAVGTVEVAGLGELVLPSSPTFIASGMTLDRPMISGGTATPSVTLQNGSRFGGFILDNPLGDGIFSNAAADTFVRDVLIQNTGGAGIHLQATDGTTTIVNTIIDNATGPAFHVDGGDGSIGFQSTSTGLIPSFGHISNSSQESVRIENMTAGGIVNTVGTTIDGNGGTGILIQNNAGSATIDNAQINNSTSTGIQILNATGSYNFRSSLRPTSVTNAALQSGLIDGLGATGNVTFEALTVNGRGAEGIDINNNAGQINFLNAVSLGAPAGGVAPGVSVENSIAGSSVIFSDSLNVTGSGGRGIEITNNPLGTSFSVFGTTSISNTTGESIAIISDAGNTSFLGGTAISNRLDRGVSIQDAIGEIAFLGITNVSADPLDLNTTPAVDIQNSEANVTFAALGITNALGTLGPPGAGIHLANNIAGADNTALLRFGNVNIDATDGAGIFGINNTSIEILGGSITTIGSEAVDLEESGWNIDLDNVNVTGSAANGIRLGNAVPSTSNRFSVGGTGAAVIGSSGSIVDSMLAGVFLQNAGQVRLRGMLLNNNLNGIVVRNSGLADDDNQLLEVTLSGITQSLIRGLDGQNLSTLFIDDSLFDDNGVDGALGRESIDLKYNEAPNDTDTTLFSQFTNPYEVFITDTMINDNTDDAVHIETLALGTGAHVNVELERNTFMLDGILDPDLADLNETAFEFDWNGVARVFLRDNSITMTGDIDVSDSQTGFDIRNSSTTDELLMSVLTNTIVAADNNSTGFRKRTLGTSDSLIEGNQFTFSGVNSTGMSLNLAADTLMNINSNELRFDEDGGAGMIFSLVNQPSIFTINNNQIGLFDNGGLIEEGIRFSASIGSPILQGNQDNLVFLLNPGDPTAFIEVPFSFGGTPVGGILVNGTRVP